MLNREDYDDSLNITEEDQNNLQEAIDGLNEQIRSLKIQVASLLIDISFFQQKKALIIRYPLSSSFLMSVYKRYNFI